MGNRINIGGRIHNTEVGNVALGANEVLDDTKGKKQNVINAETDAELLRLENEKQDNLTFDNTPTEDSVNPVTSGGVYAADAQLQEAIEAILLLIPSAASALNKLADMQFVNSSVATNTATFRGTYNSVVDLHLAVDATHAQIEAALDGLVTTADNNDYCYVQIPVSATSFDIEKTERYKFNGTNWKFEYQLNNSGFTANQWAAINSGITTALVTKLGDLPTATEIANQFTAITNLIPSEATALNQLADKAYVVAQIIAAIPAFKGQFETLAELQAVASPKAGDLGIVRTKDSDGYDVFTFYQYLNNQWNVFYTLSHHHIKKPASTGTTGDYPYNGMGRVVIPKNMVGGVNTLTQDAFEDGDGNPLTNTVFVIQYDFVLGEDITVPINCILEFDGGSVSGAYTITGQNTQIEALDVAIFKNGTIIAGTWLCPRVTSDWFNDITDINRVQQLINLTSDAIYNEVIIKGTCNVQPTSGSGADWGSALLPKSNTTINLLGSLVVGQDTNTQYGVIFIFSKENINIVGGGSIVGKTRSTTNAFGILVSDSENIKIENINISEFYDGIYLGMALDKNVTINNCKIYDCYRNGIAVTNFENVTISGCIFYNIVGTIPEYAIDIEVDENITTAKAVNCIVQNCHIVNKNGINVFNQRTDIYCENILIDNCYIDSEALGGTLVHAVGTSGYIRRVTVQNSILLGGISCYTNGFPLADETTLYRNNTIKGGVIYAGGAMIQGNKISNVVNFTNGNFVDNIIYTESNLYITNGRYINNIIEETGSIIAFTTAYFENNKLTIKVNNNAPGINDCDLIGNEVYADIENTGAIMFSSVTKGVAIKDNRFNFTGSGGGMTFLGIGSANICAIEGNLMKDHFSEGVRFILAAFLATYTPTPAEENLHNRMLWRSTNSTTGFRLYNPANTITYKNFGSAVVIAPTAERITPNGDEDNGITYRDYTDNKLKMWLTNQWVELH